MNYSHDSMAFCNLSKEILHLSSFISVDPMKRREEITGIMLRKMKIPVARQAKTTTEEAKMKEDKSKSKIIVQLILGKELVRLKYFF